jgi:hypothetical protein
MIGWGRLKRVKNNSMVEGVVSSLQNSAICIPDLDVDDQCPTPKTSNYYNMRSIQPTRWLTRRKSPYLECIFQRAVNAVMPITLTHCAPFGWVDYPALLSCKRARILGVRKSRYWGRSRGWSRGRGRGRGWGYSWSHGCLGPHGGQRPGDCFCIHRDGQVSETLTCGVSTSFA